MRLVAYVEKRHVYLKNVEFRIIYRVDNEMHVAQVSGPHERLN
jgi:hypothetical protein